MSSTEDEKLYKMFTSYAEKNTSIFRKFLIDIFKEKSKRILFQIGHQYMQCKSQNSFNTYIHTCFYDYAFNNTEKYMYLALYHTIIFKITMTF